ncbi:response regulator transcription factor, partial [Lysinibacillus fusiformis]|uniref:response regulator transcription factor n=1 Tax=Lysinibacillus fusiformis TaxID=28031 RepID=UPI0020BF3647
TKPFEHDELLARIRKALLSSQKASPKQVALAFGHLSIIEQTREVVHFNKDIQLTPREYDLLFYLLKHPKQVLTREQLLEAVWDYDYYGDTNVVDVYVRCVRQ